MGAQGKLKMVDGLCNRSVTMEDQKFEITEDPSKTLPERSPMDPIREICF